MERGAAGCSKRHSRRFRAFGSLAQGMRNGRNRRGAVASMNAMRSRGRSGRTGPRTKSANDRVGALPLSPPVDGVLGFGGPRKQPEAGRGPQDPWRPQHRLARCPHHCARAVTAAAASRPPPMCVCVCVSGKWHELFSFTESTCPRMRHVCGQSGSRMQRLAQGETLTPCFASCCLSHGRSPRNRMSLAIHLALLVEMGGARSPTRRAPPPAMHLQDSRGS